MGRREREGPAGASLSVGAPGPRDRDTFYPVPPAFPICVHVLLCYQALQMELPEPLLIIIFIFISPHNVSKSLGAGTVVFVGETTAF